MRSRRTTTRQRAFTLIELLVVIAVIAILVAMLVPFIINLKRSAQLTGCTSNMRQLHMGLIVYSDMFNSYLPTYELAAGNQRNVLVNAAGEYQGVALLFKEGGAASIFPDMTDKLLRCPGQRDEQGGFAKADG